MFRGASEQCSKSGMNVGGNGDDRGRNVAVFPGFSGSLFDKRNLVAYDRTGDILSLSPYRESRMSIELSPSSASVSVSPAERLDVIGASISFACAVHCVLIPFVFTVLPFVGLGFLASSAFETAMIVVALLVATGSFIWGSLVHRRRRVFVLLVVAVLFFVAAHEMSYDAHWYLMGLGGGCLAVGHLVNRRLCNSCRECACGH